MDDKRNDVENADLEEIFDEEELDLVTFVDEDGSERILEVRDYFYYNGEEYAVLIDFDDEDDTDDESDDVEEPESVNAYIMKVNPVGEDEEEFIPVEDDKLYEELIEIAQTRFDDMEEEEFVDAEDPEE